MTSTDFAAMSVGQFVEDLGGRAPVPGGGAVAGVTAALAAAVSRMVVSYSAGKKSLAEHDELHENALQLLQDHAQAALRGADEDARAYGALNALWKLPEDDPIRKSNWDDVVRDAIEAPASMLSTSVGILQLLKRLCGATNRMLDSDLAIGAILAEAGARAAAWNVQINLPSLEDDAARAARGLEVHQMLETAARLSDDVVRHCRQSQGLDVAEKQV